MRLHDITLQEVSRPPEMEDAIPILTKAGWHRVGHGFYAEVFAHPKTDYILKLFDAYDSAYLDFLTLVKNKPNPHFPKLIGKPMKITDLYWAIRMEKLEPNHDGLEFSSYFNIRNGSLKPEHKYQFNAYKAVEAYLQQNPKMKVALDLIYDILLPRYTDDLHKDNAMQRANGTLVIIDPVAF